MGRIRLVRITFGKANKKAKRSNKNHKRCPQCGRYI